MGLAQSQEPQLRRNSFSRANRNSGKSSKRDELQTKFEAIDNVKTEIDLFGGNRQSERYSQIQQILTTISKDFQETKTSSSKQKTRNKCDEALGEIQNCLKRLENRVEFNEQTLDSAAVESHSFIQSFTPRQQDDDTELAKTLNRIQQELLKLEHDIRLNLEWNDQNNLKLFEKKIQLLYKDLEMIVVDYQTPLGQQKMDIANKLDKCSNQLKKSHEDTHKSKVINEPPQIADANNKPRETLSRIEESVLKLERDIKLCIELDDHNQLKLLKKKIQLLYTDLEMIVVDNHTPLSEKKAAIGKKLIKYNNQIRKSKRTSLQTMENIDKKLEQLGGEALMFNGTKSDGKYKSLQQELENYWSMVYPLECISSEERNKKEHLVAKIKNTLEELSNRAEEGQKQFEALGKLNEQANRIKQLHENAVGFTGRSSDQTFVSVDQELRDIWTKLSEIDDTEETVQRRKEETITEIQTALKILNENCISHRFYEDVESKSEDLLLDKARAFEDQWNKLSCELDHRVTNSDTSRSLVDILRKISSGMSEKVRSLDIIEKRKSTGSLVTVKILDTADEVKKLPNPIYTEIKAQPTVKAIGEIQRIGLQAKAIQQEIHASNCTKNDKEYEHFRTKLEECRNSLEKIDYNKKSDTIESNKRRALKTVLEAFRMLEENPCRSSKACEVMDIHAEILYFRQQIKTFNGVTKDLNYTKIKQGLSDCLAKLQLIHDNLAIKQDKIRQIQLYHQELETKLAENQAKVKINKEIADTKRQISHETKNVIEDVQKLKSQVERFSGVYDGLQFKQIQESLQNCLQKLDNINTNGDEKLENAKTQTKQKIHKYLQILEERSSKPEMVAERSHESPHRKINVLRDRLVDIKVRTEEFEGKYKDSGYIKIEEELFKCLEELKVINDGGHKSIVVSKEQYEDYIVKLLEYFAEKTKRNDAEVKDPTKELAEIGNNVADLKCKIDTESSDSTTFINKVEELRELLQNIEVGNVIHMRELRKQLLDDLEGCRRLIYRKLKSREKFDEIWKNIMETSEEVERFVGVKNDKNYCRLDEVLIQLMMELDKIDYMGNSDLKGAKQQAMQMIQRSMATLDNRVIGGATVV